MARRRVEDYIRGVRQEYIQFKEHIDLILPDIENLNRELKAVQEDPLLSGEGKKKKAESLSKKKQELEKELSKVQDKARKRYAAMREELKGTFNGYFGLNVGQLDTKALSVLNADILSTDEILALAENYKGNAIMLRIIGKKLLEKPVNSETAAKAKAFTQAGRIQTYLNVFDGVTMWAMNGLGDAPDGRYSNNAANFGTARLEKYEQDFPKMEAEALSGTPCVEWDSDSGTYSQYERDSAVGMSN